MNIFKTAAGKIVLFLLTFCFIAGSIIGILGFAIAADNNMYDGTFIVEDNSYCWADLGWMEAKAKEVIEKAKYDNLPRFDYTFEGYGYVVYEGNEVICEAWPGGFCKESNLMIVHRKSEGLYDVEIYVYRYGMRSDFSIKMLALVDKYKFEIIYGTALCLILGIAGFITLMCVSARKNKIEEPVPGFVSRIPTDIALLVYGLIGGGICALVSELFVEFDLSEYVCAVVVAVAGSILLMLLLGFFMDFAARIKLKNLFTNTLIYKVIRAIGKLIKKTCHVIGEFIKAIPFIWVALVAIALIIMAEFFGIAISAYSGGDMLGVAVLWVLEKLFLTPVVIYFIWCMYKLNIGAKKLSEGNFTYKTDISHMIFHFKDHGRWLNNISVGMDRAVSESLKSERMKTELITNVSHDIKTPLTSIINYADLIGKEPTDNEKITEYAEVVTRQSAKLKRLLEDLLELSKTSTGNIEINFEKCDAGILLSQAAGEYEEKITAAGLETIVTIPEEEIFVCADRRKLWRVFDNLLSNMCKYALTGSRVYLSLATEGDDVVFSFKNTSRDMLNISTEELKERFVRGDRSRNTEGNGLGLSIAENLVNAQKGKLDISIDADLFTVKVIFKRMIES